MRCANTFSVNDREEKERRVLSVASQIRRVHSSSAATVDQCMALWRLLGDFMTAADLPLDPLDDIVPSATDTELIN